MRVATLLLLGLGMTAFAPPAFAQAPKPPELEYLGTLRADTGTRTVIENGAAGDAHGRAKSIGGRFEGPRLKASVQIPAGDWITNRADGSYRLDVRLTLKTDDGALILVTYNGIGQTTSDRRVAADCTALRDRRSALRLAHTTPGGRRRRARRHHGEVRHLRAEVEAGVSCPRAARWRRRSGWAQPRLAAGGGS